MGNVQLEIPDLAQQTALKNSQVTRSLGLPKNRHADRETRQKVTTPSSYSCTMVAENCVLGYLAS